MSNLNVYRDTVNPNKLLSDESATLADLGIEVRSTWHTSRLQEFGNCYDVQGSEVKGETEATLVYDFQPHHSTCPLLNDPPTTLYQVCSLVTHEHKPACERNARAACAGHKCPRIITLVRARVPMVRMYTVELSERWRRHSPWQGLLVILVYATSLAVQS